MKALVYLILATSASVANPAIALDSAPAPVATEEAKPAKKPPTAKQLAQRERMKRCNAEAKAQGLKKEARKAFMSTCLKADKQ